MADIEFNQFKKLLKKNGYFVTQPRMNLFGHMQKRPALTFKDLLKLTKQYDEVTLYRNIDLFEKLGIIKKIRMGWETKIELSDIFQLHHHHFTCISCGKVITLHDDSIIEKHIANLGKSGQFTITDHQLEISGICKACSIKKNRV